MPLRHVPLCQARASMCTDVLSGPSMVAGIHNTTIYDPHSAYHMNRCMALSFFVRPKYSDVLFVDVGGTLEP